MVGGAMILATLAAAVIVEAPSASAAGPAFVQSASGTGNNATTGSSVPITATLGKACTTGDTLVAFVTIAQQVGDAGAVALTPPGWTRLYEHSPSGHVAAYHVWFALSGCSGVSAATFTITAPGNPNGTTGSVVLSEYSGLPSPLMLKYGTNAGGGAGASSGSLTSDVSAPSGTVVLTALSIYSPSAVTSTPSGWSAVGSARRVPARLGVVADRFRTDAVGLVLVVPVLRGVGAVHGDPRRGPLRWSPQPRPRGLGGPVLGVVVRDPAPGRDRR